LNQTGNYTGVRTDYFRFADKPLRTAFIIAGRITITSSAACVVLPSLRIMIFSDGNRSRAIGKCLLVFLAIWQAAMAKMVLPACLCYSIQLGPVEQTVTIGDPLGIEVTVANTTDHDIQLARNSRYPEDLYFVDVRNANGIRQKMTDRYSDITNLLHYQVSGEIRRPTAYRDKNGTVHIETYGGSGEPTLIVKPGGEVKVTIPLNRLYELDEAGTYTIQIKQMAGKDEIDSNVVTVKITN
jgi:hypothetical protein